MTHFARFTRPFVLVLALCALTLAGCGEKKEVNLEGKEGARINIGGLVYQVQLSRILNPTDVGDSQYTQGLPEPGADSEYYGVFIRVDNEEGGKAITSVPLEAFKIHDAGGTEYHPIESDAAPGMAYAPVSLAEGDRIPVPDSASDNNPVKGSLMLFKITRESLENRPLILEIEGKGGVTGEVTLDV